MAVNSKMKSRLAISDAEANSQSLEPQTIERAAKLFRNHGAIWLENALPVALVKRLAKAYQQTYTSASAAQLKRRHAVVGDQRFMITLTIEPPFNTPKLYANPILSQVLASLLGSQFGISSFGSVVTLPGAGDQPIHFDHPPLFETEKDCTSLPPYAITVVVPLVDIKEETGSTAIWEGSHRKSGSRKNLLGLMNDPSWNGSVHPLPKLGDVYLMDYRVIHGGMANNCDQPRPILYLVYGRPWFRDAYNFSDQPPVKFADGEFKKVPVAHRGLFAGHEL